MDIDHFGHAHSLVDRKSRQSSTTTFGQWLERRSSGSIGANAAIGMTEMGILTFPTNQPTLANGHLGFVVRSGSGNGLPIKYLFRLLLLFSVSLRNVY